MQTKLDAVVRDTPTATNWWLAEDGLVHIVFQTVPDLTLTRRFADEQTATLLTLVARRYLAQELRKHALE